VDVEKLYTKFGVDLQAHGRTWKGLCPFHIEDTPSFVVYPNASFYCFGCQRGGSYAQFRKYCGDDDDAFVAVCQEPDNIKEKSLFDLIKLKVQLDAELFLLLEDVPYKVKRKAWERFDEIWLDVSFLESEQDSDLIDVLLLLRSSFSEIKKFVKKI
jgi:hypothetical protein